MAITKFIAPALAVAGTAYASCSASGTTTISNPSDIATCSTFSGNIAVATGASSGGTTDFGDIEKIDGDFTYEGDAAVQIIKLASLKEITGDLTLSNLTALSSSGLGSLKTVGGGLTFEGLGLNDMGLDAGLEEVGLVQIINTGIQSLNGIGNVSEISGLSISDNLNLGEIALSVSQIDSISIGSGQQSNGGQSASFKNLISAKSIVIRNSSSVDLSALSNVTNDLRLIGNTIDSFSAKNLTSVGALILDSNNQMKNASFPSLEEIKSKNATLYISRNNKLNSIDGFPKLEQVTGDVYVYGNFSKLDFDAITRIDGALRVETASDSFDCDPVTDLGSKGSKKVVKGDDKCKSGDKTKLNGGSDSSSTSDSASESSSSPASPLEIPADFMSGFVILGSMLSMFM